jgi:hypothetical protein
LNGEQVLAAAESKAGDTPDAVRFLRKVHRGALKKFCFSVQNFVKAVDFSFRLRYNIDTT